MARANNQYSEPRLGAAQSTQAAAAVAVAAGIPTILWGEPGIGKTAWARSFSEANGLHLETVIASIRDPTDFSGLPVVCPDGGVAFAPPRWAKTLEEKGGGLLFLDEISTAPPAVQSALLRVVLDRTVGDLALPEGVKILAAANPVEAAAGGWDLTPPLSNRLCHLRWPVDASGIARGFMAGWPEPEVVVLPSGWDEGVRLQEAVIGAFLERFPGHAHGRPGERSLAGGPWPSPRTWEYAARVLAACSAAGVSSSIADTLVAGCVGDGPGAEFAAWLEDQELPDPHEVLAAPDAFTVPDRADRAYTLARAVVAIATTEGKTARSMWTSCWKALERIGGVRGNDVVVPPAMDLVACRAYASYAAPEQAASLWGTMRGAGMFGDT